jgi:hypothetical protein
MLLLLLGCGNLSVVLVGVGVLLLLLRCLSGGGRWGEVEAG